LFSYNVSEIYSRVYEKELDVRKDDKKFQRDQREINLLKMVCQETPSNFNLIQDLLKLQKNKALLNRKRGLKDDIERVIEQYIN